MWLFALNMTWTHCEVYWDLDFEPSENQWRAANGIWGVRYLAWRLFFVLDFDNWSMGAKPWNTSGGQPVVFGLSGNPKPRKVINLRSSSKLASVPRFVRHLCLRNPCLLSNLSLHSVPEAWGPWEPQHAPPALQYGCIMPIPSLQLKKKDSLMQRSRRFGHGVVVSKICYLRPRFGLQDIDCALTCDMWLLQTSEQLSRLSF